MNATASVADGDAPSRDRRIFPLRFATYLAERFPPVEHGVLIAAFAAGNAFVAQAAVAEGGPILVGPRLLLAAGVLVLVFFHFRVFDECKDAATDAALQPDRPIQRGVVTLGEVKLAGAIAIAAQFGLVTLLGAEAMGAHVLVVGFSIVMLNEFFVGDWLRPHLFLYAVPHTLSASVIGLFVATAVTGLSVSVLPTAMLLYALSHWAGFTVFEVARKTHGPEEEKPGVDTYSSLWGPGGAAAANFALIAITGAVAAAAGFPLGLGMAFSIAFGVAVAGLGVASLAYAKAPSARAAKTYYTLSSLFLLAHSVIPAVVIGVARGVAWGGAL